ncbi:hypothetical protein [Thalassobellus citreus]|uniref:hypothetical protein n=1 Tax=Thalassobellus citreus TaxID=3367752 RepID=UPI0037A16D94
MPYKLLLIYGESVITTLFTVFLSVLWVSAFSITAAILSILRVIYLFQLDVKRNHNGSYKAWFKVLLKKN